MAAALVPVLALALATGVSAQARGAGAGPPQLQPPPQVEGSGGSTRVVSARVVAMWRATGVGRGGPATLSFLILWRGQAGWAMQGSQGGRSGGMGTGVETVTQNYGPHQLSASFDRALRTVTIQGQRINLGDDNVVLVDEADQPGKARVVGTMKVDGAMPDGTGRIDPVIQRVPELIEFLQCGARLADANRQVMMDAICAQVTGRASPPASLAGPPRGLALERASWIEAKARLTPETVVVIPLGAAAKEHGPHLKLSNDWIMAEYFGRRVLAAADVVLAPVINYSFYPAFVNYPGSTTLTEDTARDVVVQICKSLASHGPKRFYVLNTGVSTVRPLKAAQSALAADGIAMEFTDILAVAGETVKAVSEQREGTHADEIETSMMLYIAPQMVDMNKVVREYPTGTGPLTPVAGAPGRFSASGVSGDATLATRAKGEKVVEATVAGILAQIDALRRK